jgi:hypothetical protein
MSDATTLGLIFLGALMVVAMIAAAASNPHR